MDSSRDHEEQELDSQGEVSHESAASTGERSALIDCAALVIVLAGLTLASQIVVPFLMAAFLGILASPLVSFFESKRVPRVIATLGIVLALLGLLTIVSLIVTSSVNTLTSSLPEYRALISERLWDTQLWLEGHGIQANVEDVFAFIDFGAIFNVTSGLLSGVAGLQRGAHPYCHDLHVDRGRELAREVREPARTSHSLSAQ